MSAKRGLPCQWCDGPCYTDEIASEEEGTGMDLETRLEWFLKMLSCKYTADLLEYDAMLVPRMDLQDDRIRLLHKMLQYNGSLEMLQHLPESSHGVAIISSSMDLLWGCVCLQENGHAVRYFILGPVLGEELDPQDVDHELKMMLNSGAAIDEYTETVMFQRYISEVVRALPVVVPRRFQEDVAMLGCCITGECCPCSEIMIISPKSNVETSKREPRRENKRKRTWETEQALLQMVRDGNLNYETVLSQAGRVSDGVQVKVRGSLQRAQISSTTLVTLCVRAGIEGGLSPDTAYSVGDSYIQTILDCKTMGEIVQINHAAFDDFVHRVHEVKKTEGISPRIQKCIDYLELHEEEEVSIAQLAELTGYTEYYLSRKFKEETGSSVNDYSKRLRIERAKLLLRTTRASAAQLAERLHFCSGSYFAREFRRYTGQSPAEYREANKR